MEKLKKLWLTHAELQMFERYGHFCSMRELLALIRAGRYRNVPQDAFDGHKLFDVVVEYTDGSSEIVRAVVSASLSKVVTILPTETPLEILDAKAGERKRAYFKQARHVEEGEEVESCPENFLEVPQSKAQNATLDSSVKTEASAGKRYPLDARNLLELSSLLTGKES